MMLFQKSMARMLILKLIVILVMVWAYFSYGSDAVFIAVLLIFLLLYTEILLILKQCNDSLNLVAHSIILLYAVMSGAILIVLLFNLHNELPVALPILAFITICITLQASIVFNLLVYISKLNLKKHILSPSVFLLDAKIYVLILLTVSSVGISYTELYGVFYNVKMTVVDFCLGFVYVLISILGNLLIMYVRAKLKLVQGKTNYFIKGNLLWQMSSLAPVFFLMILVNII